MGKTPDIVTQLNAIDAWLSISNRLYVESRIKEIFPHYKNEQLNTFFEGFYKEQDASSNLYGILILTDKRIVFISGEKKNPLTREIILDKLTFTETKKKFSTCTFIFQSAKIQMVFDAIQRNVDLDDLIKTLPCKNRIQNAVDNPDAVIFRENVTLVNTEAPVTEAGAEAPDTNAEQDFLLNEIRKLHRFLANYADQASQTIPVKLIINDLLSLISWFNKRNYTENEKLFLLLLLIPFLPEVPAGEYNLAYKFCTNSGEPLPAVESFAVSWDVLIKLFAGRAQKTDIFLLALESAGKYDSEQGSREYDKLRRFYYTVCQCLAKVDNTITEIEKEKLNAIYSIIYKSSETGKKTRQGQSRKEGKKSGEDQSPPESLDTVLKEIQSLVGMANIKEQINTLINLIKIQKERELHHLPATQSTLHSVFYGPPGTGKTTIARLLGRVFKCLGLLAKGHLVETDRAGLVAGYVGQTAIKVDEVVTKSMDGILFIDEAYTLKPDDGGKDFGQEAIEVLLKRMEDYRARFIVIVAGYPDEMKGFIQSNPGLKSRFNRYFYFDHYTPEELLQIFNIFSKNVEVKLTRGAVVKVLKLLKDCHARRDKSFGNGRLVRNIFELVMEKQANRIAGMKQLNTEILSTVTVADIPEQIDEMM